MIIGYHNLVIMIWIDYYFSLINIIDNFGIFNKCKCLIYSNYKVKNVKHCKCKEISIIVIERDKMMI
jgi:hypothetical protein